MAVQPSWDTELCERDAITPDISHQLVLHIDYYTVHCLVIYWCDTCLLLSVTCLLLDHAHMPASFFTYRPMHVSTLLLVIVHTLHATCTSIKLTPAFAELWFGLPSKCRDGARPQGDGTESVSVDDVSGGDHILFSLCLVMHVIFIVFLVVYGMYYSDGFVPIPWVTCYVSDGSPHLFMRQDPSLYCSVLISDPKRYDRVVDVLMYSEFVGTFMICYLCLLLSLLVV